MGNRFIAELRGPCKAACTIVCKGHAANKKETRQIIKKKKPRKHKRNHANKKENRETKKKPCKQKRKHANKKIGVLNL